jgi:hypothetical protein
MTRMISRGAFVAMVNQRVLAKAGVELDDLADFNVDDFLDTDDGIAADAADEAADDAARAVLEENGWEGDA